MSSDWPVVTLQDITTILGDGLHGTPKYDQLGDYYFINGNNLNNGRIVITDKTKRASRKEYEKYKKEFNDRTILVSINGTLGNIAFYNGEKVFPGKSACYFNVKQTVDKHFVRYMLESRVFQNYIHNLATGSTIKNVSLKLMREFSFKLPPVKIQTSISSILKSLDEKIQLNQNINQTLEQMAQAIFKSWFVDFEPVKTKIAALEAGGSEDDALLAAMQAIAGSTLFATDAADADAPTQLARLQTEHPEQYATLRATAELFPSAMQESELGEIPEGWNVGTLADFSDLNKNSWTAKTIPEEIDYVDLANTKNGVIESTTKYLSGDAPSRARRKLFNGDTIIGTVRPGNRSFAFIKQPSGSLTGSTGFAVLSPKSPEFAEYIYIAATSDAAINHLAYLADGGAYPAVRSEVVAGITAVVPKSPVLMCFHEMVRPYFDISASLKTGNKTLAELRDTLLPKLLSGELSVAEAE
ncbi:MAG: restriction endonuclease subunit S [Pseudomonas sp.]|nr:restriction endonuclease subunit S [Pseudomonas sp.]